jgi:hypothetical protein
LTSENNTFQGKFFKITESLSLLILIQLALSISFIFIVNLVLYPFDDENNSYPFSTHFLTPGYADSNEIVRFLAIFLIIIRTGYLLFVGYLWGKYSIEQSIFSFFKPLFFYGVIVLLTILSQVLFLGVSFFVGSFLIIDLDVYFVYLILNSTLIDVSVAAIFVNAIFSIIGIVLVPLFIFFCFYIGMMLSKLVNRRKTDFNSSIEIFNDNKRRSEIKFLFAFLWIVFTVIFRGNWESGVQYLSFKYDFGFFGNLLVYQAVGTIGLSIGYLFFRRDFTQKIKKTENQLNF